jgi:hypothetical protein
MVSGEVAVIVVDINEVGIVVIIGIRDQLDQLVDDASNVAG